MDDQLRQAVLGATNIQSPSSPLGSFPELAKLYQSTFQLPQSTAGAGALGNIAKQQVEEQKAAAQARKQQLANKLDPSKYEVRAKDDGGYDFFDPEGNQIDIATYAQFTGKRPVDVLKDSQNPIDVQYVEDYKNLQDFMQAVVNQRTEVVKAFTDKEDALKKYSTPGGLDKLISDFKKYYQRYYVPRTAQPEAWGIRPQPRQFVPRLNPDEDFFPNTAGTSGTRSW